MCMLGSSTHESDFNGERECPFAESASISLETKYEIDADSADGHLPLPRAKDCILARTGTYLSS